MSFRHLVTRVPGGPTLRPARAYLTRPCYPNTSFPRKLIPPQSIAFSTKFKFKSHLAPTTPETEKERDLRFKALGLHHSFADDAITIQNSLKEYNLSQWGFVIFRCTYSSQEKWDKFVYLAKRHAREYFEVCGMESIHDSIRWTIIEDAATLDGADILETSRRFEEWVNRGPGRQEMEGTAFTPTWHYSPRYRFFLHADEESLESVVDDVKAKEQGGYFCKIVRGEMVLSAEKEREELRAVESEEQQQEEEDEGDLWDQRRRVKLDGLVSLYAGLQDYIDRWYCLPMDGDIILW